VETYTGSCKEDKPSSTYIGFCGYISSLRWIISTLAHIGDIMLTTTTIAIGCGWFGQSSRIQPE
jgi:hypothetical protein